VFFFLLVVKDVFFEHHLHGFHLTYQISCLSLRL
jgi:hypothetical protein